MNKTFPTIFIFLLLLTLSTSCRARRTTPNPLTTDIGVTINGITWATRNVDAPGTFAANPEDVGMFFQWNRRKGWSTTDAEVEEWDSSIPEGTKWYAENDPCPEGWRVPTEDELRSLLWAWVAFRNAGSEWTRINGRSGRLFGTVPNQIFLPAAGARDTSGALLGAGTWGYYWSSTSGDALGGWGLDFNCSGNAVTFYNRVGGFSVRCVKIN